MVVGMFVFIQSSALRIWRQHVLDVFGTGVCLEFTKAICSQCHKRHSPQDGRPRTSYGLMCVQQEQLSIVFQTCANCSSCYSHDFLDLEAPHYCLCFSLHPAICGCYHVHVDVENSTPAACKISLLLLLLLSYCCWKKPLHHLGCIEPCYLSTGAGFLLSTAHFFGFQGTSGFSDLRSNRSCAAVSFGCYQCRLADASSW